MWEEKHAPRSRQSARGTATVSPGEAPAASVTILAPGTPLGERYEIRGLLGSGGFAVVYRAFDRELKREVALKVLKAERMSDAVLERFRREAAVTRDAASPRLLRTFDIGSAAGTIFLAMEVVDGPSLRDRLEDGPLPVAEALRVTVEILEGLSVLHSLGIVHRDVKPGNVLLAEDGVKLADFGLAIHFEEPVTRITVTGAALGTLEYMAPEQVLGHTVDARADLYSLGLVLFEMLAGDLPCKRKSSLGTLLAHLDSSIPDVRQLRPEAPKWISRILVRLLEKRPADRYQSADAVLVDVRAGRFPFFRTRRFRRLAAATVLITAGVAAGGGLWWRSEDRLQYSHLVALGHDAGVAAIGKHGETLWSLPEIDPNTPARSALVRLGTDEPPRLATILLKKYEYPPERTRTLSFLDPNTGKIVKQVHLPTGATHFLSYSDRYCPHEMRVEDLDHDGVDEIFITYQHVPEWPFFVVLYEPRYERSRVVFVSSGAHHALGVEDVDGDGRADLILAGINNLLGWHYAAAAVRIVPWIGEALGDINQYATSPDDLRDMDYGRLIWYVLLPKGDTQIGERPISASSESHSLWVTYRDGSRQEVSFDGFLPEPISRKQANLRERGRRQSYHQLREALRLIRAGFADEAVAAIEAAVSHAEDADLPLLVECMQRFHGRILVRAGQLEAAEALFRDLARDSPYASEIAYDAAESFHLQGELERALSWYRLGTGPGASGASGKNKTKFLRGEILALVELRRWRDAQNEISRFENSYPSLAEAGNIYREYVRWRSGETPRFEHLSVTPHHMDSERYWVLEFKNSRGLDPDELLSEVERLMVDVYDVRGQLLSLKSELLLKLGKKDEALDIARTAFDLVMRDRTTMTLARGHLDLVAARLARAARANHREEEAARAEEWAREALTRLGASQLTSRP